MSKKHRISADDKVKYVQDYLDGKDSIRHISSTLYAIYLYIEIVLIFL
ncbi:hypothetical protein [Clostridium senegalense]